MFLWSYEPYTNWGVKSKTVNGGSVHANKGKTSISLFLFRFQHNATF